jgi:hypothetical protein
LFCTAVRVGVLVLAQIGPVALEVCVEARQIGRRRGPLARIVSGRTRRQGAELPRDGEQPIVFSGREVASLDAGPDQRLRELRQTRDMLILKQNLIADRAPQLRLAVITRRGLITSGGAVAPIDLGDDRALRA